MSPAAGGPVKQGRWTRLDLDRRERCGLPEVVLAEGKTRAQLEEALQGLLEAHGQVLLTRLAPDLARWLA